MKNIVKTGGLLILLVACQIKGEEKMRENLRCTDDECIVKIINDTTVPVRLWDHTQEKTVSLGGRHAYVLPVYSALEPGTEIDYHVKPARSWSTWFYKTAVFDIKWDYEYGKLRIPIAWQFTIKNESCAHPLRISELMHKTTDTFNEIISQHAAADARPRRGGGLPAQVVREADFDCWKTSIIFNFSPYPSRLRL